jgi:FixJ family two-component response regulator
MERFNAPVLVFPTTTRTTCHFFISGRETMNINIKPSGYSEALRAAPPVYAPCMPDIAAAPMAEQFTVFIVDDDPGVLKSLARFVRASGYAVRTFASADELLAHDGVHGPGCLVLDLLMPGIDGRELQAAICKGESEQSIIFISGTTDAPTIVEAMKAGAIDFLIKPVDGNALLAALATAVEQQTKLYQRQIELANIKHKLAQLTPREAEVLRHVIAGRLNKQIAWTLGTVEKTIKVHRGRIMEKMAVRSIAELVRLTEQIGIAPCEEEEPHGKDSERLIIDIRSQSGRGGHALQVA